jgi:hypothetical protein
VPERMEKEKQYDLVSRLIRDRHACRMAAWAIETLDADPPEDDNLKTEICGGLHYMLEAVANDLSWMNSQFNLSEKP